MGTRVWSQARDHVWRMGLGYLLVLQDLSLYMTERYTKYFSIHEVLQGRGQYMIVRDKRYLDIHECYRIVSCTLYVTRSHKEFMSRPGRWPLCDVE